MSVMAKNYEEQVNALLAQLTLEEKVSMIHGCGLFRTQAVERLGIPSLKMSDGPMGVRQEFPDDSWIPCGYSDDYVTYSPSNSAVAATWNPGRAYEGGKTLGEEARGRGKDVILAPGINIKRDPLCGRNFEYMSEDPYLIKTLAVPFIKGVQESDVAACVKHFAVNNQETDRLMVDTVVDERTLREIYLPGFQAAVQEAGSYSLMNAYNKLNGAHCSENKELLDYILREEWEYDGTVISDWGSVHSTKGAAEASMDVEMSVTYDFDDYYFAKPLLEAVKKGEVAEEEIDKKVKNILRMMYRLKMLGEEAPQRRKGAYNTREHQQSTLETAREAIVLLKNEENVLPVSKERLSAAKKIAV
ncbi:MAG: glycoside hydrolase family 3 N-terminal domain-containing protein, partial [Acetatifactor sp.]